MLYGQDDTTAVATTTTTTNAYRLSVGFRRLKLHETLQTVLLLMG